MKNRATDSYEAELYKSLIEACDDKAFQDFMTAEYSVIKDVSNSKSKTFIDLGSGYGRVISYLTSICKELYSIEKNPQMFSALESECKSYRNAKAVEGDFFDLRFIAKDLKINRPIVVTLLQNSLGTVDYKYKELLNEIKEFCITINGELIISFFRQEYLKDWGVNLYEIYFSKMVGSFDSKKSNLEKGRFVTNKNYKSKWRNSEEIEEIISYLEAEVVQAKEGKGFSVHHLRFPMLSVKQEFRKRYEEFINNLNKKEPKSFEESLPKHLEGCNPSLNKTLLSSIPEYYFKLFGDNTVSFSDYIDFWSPDGSLDDINKIDGIVTAHSLSPRTDTIFLLCDLGRTLRISSAIGKTPTILLAGDQWSSFNRTVKRFGGELEVNQQFRDKLYNRVGCKIKHCGIGTDEVKDFQVKSLAGHYEQLTKSLFGEDFITKDISNQRLEVLVNEVEIIASKDLEENHNRYNLYQLPFIKEKLKSEIEAILQVKKNLKNCSKDTFIYYFAQRFNQHNFSKFFKIAVRSERNFDFPFRELDTLEGKSGIKHAIYFKDYEFNSADGTGQFVLPYYFPSGSFLSKSDDTDFNSHVITLDDKNNEEKVCRLFSQIKYPHNARMVADLLSFCQFLINPFGTTTRKNYDGRLEVILDWGSKEFEKSWKYYFGNEEDFHKKMNLWKEYMFYSLPETIPVPYFYFPFILIRDERYKEKINKSFYGIFKFIIDNLGD